jgi:filamentous hemagglutinin
LTRIERINCAALNNPTTFPCNFPLQLSLATFLSFYFFLAPSFHQRKSNSLPNPMFRYLVTHAVVVSFLLHQFLFIGAAYAQMGDSLPITPDGTTNSIVTQTASGIDQINIAAPNSAGLSHNKFTNYNVNSSGQILNNFSAAATDVTATQIGGLVTANSNLSSSGSASIILNEVTSNNVSQLLGYVEIAGSKADLIIANPNGITCAGCGFINVSRLGIIGGKSEFDANGNLGFDLTKTAATQLAIPVITIDGLGLDASTTTSADIIASGVKLISTIYGGADSDLTIKTGDGKYDYASKRLAPDSSHFVTGDEPLFAIDASSLAKIQSGRIFLIATKEGLGVNMAAEILAGNKVEIDAKGNVYYANITAGESVNLKSSSVILSGAKDLVNQTPEILRLAQDDTVVTSLNIAITANELNNTGSLLANNQTLTLNNLNNSGLIYGEDSLGISGINLTNSGNIFSPQDYAITLTGLLTNSGLISSTNHQQLSADSLVNSGEISGNNLTLTIANSLTNSGEILATNDQQLTANNLANSGEIQSGDDFTLNLSSLTNSENSSIYSAKKLTLNLSDSLTNSGEISALDRLSIYGTAAITNSHKILSASDLIIAGNSLNNSSSGAIASLAEALTFTLFGDLENYGELAAQKNLSITSNNLANSGNILALNNLTISATNSINNSGNLQSADEQWLTTRNLTNSGGIISNGFLKIDLGSNDYVISGDLIATHIEIAANNITNNTNLSAADSIILIAQGDILNKAAAEFLAGTTLDVTAKNITNYGTFSAVTDLTFNSNNLTNNDLIGSGNNINFNIANDFTNNRLATILAVKDISIKSTNAGSDNLYKISNFLNNSAHIESLEGNIAISAKNFTNKRDNQDINIVTLPQTAENQDEQIFYETGTYASTPIYRVNHGFSGIDFSKSTNLSYYDNIAYTLYDGKGDGAKLISEFGVPANYLFERYPDLSLIPSQANLQ